MSANHSLLDLMRSIEVQRQRSYPTGETGWELRPTREQKEAILTTVVRSNGNLRLFYRENPSIEMNGWSGHAGSGYVIPPEVDIEELVNFLYLGGWTIANITSGVSDLICSLGLENIFAFMETHSINVVVASFWDDIEWTVAVRGPPTALSISPP